MRKILSGALASALLLSSVMCLSGCNKKVAREKEIIKETDAWYSYSEVDLAANSGAPNYKGSMFSKPVVIDGMIFADYVVAYDSDAEYLPQSPICVFDEEGNLIREFETTEDIPKSHNLCVSEYNGTPVTYYASEGKLCRADINKSTGLLENPHELSGVEGSVQFVVCAASEDHVFAIGSQSGSNYFYVFENEKMVYKKDYLEPYISDVYVTPRDGGFQLRIYSSLYFYDPETNELKADGFMSVDQRDSLNKEVIGYDGRTYVKESDGIYVDGEPYVMFSDIDCNIYNFMIADLLDVTEDTIALSREGDQLMGGSPIVMLLHKEESNPNGGKTVIKAASYGNTLDEMTGEAIRRFNSENKDYFIKFMSMTTQFVDGEEYNDEYERTLKEEIVSSEAADIYFGVDSLWWFQTEDYFVDLSKELEFDENTYYTKIISSASRDGKLFYVPLTYIAEGLWVERSDVKEGAKGFTYDEYREFVSTVGNGKDAVSEFTSRDDYLFTCFAMMNDTWFKDGKVNVANGDFEALTGFFENVQENPTYNQEDILTSSYYDIETNPNYSYDIMTPFFFNQIIGGFDDPVFLGLPTADGRGAGAIIASSVSVSAVSDLKDGCIDFIRMLLSDDIQMLTNGNPINRNALPNVLDRNVEVFMKEYERAGITSEAEEALYGYYKPTEEMKNAYIMGMENVEVVPATDPSIRAIVREELSACFSGQKDVKEVEKTLEDRLKTLYSEKYNS